jgi:hypothetical protein
VLALGVAVGEALPRRRFSTLLLIVFSGMPRLLAAPAIYGRQALIP